MLSCVCTVSRDLNYINVPPCFSTVSIRIQIELTGNVWAGVTVAPKNNGNILVEIALKSWGATGASELDRKITKRKDEAANVYKCK